MTDREVYYCISCGKHRKIFDSLFWKVNFDIYPLLQLFLFFSEFFKNFFNTDLLLGKRVSDQVVQASWNVAAGASPTASLACVNTWLEDFRKDLAQIDVPTLVIHGDADRILPIAASGLRTAKLIKGSRLQVVKDGPHCVTWTHADQVNRELLAFLGESWMDTQPSRERIER